MSNHPTSVDTSFCGSTEVEREEKAVSDPALLIPGGCDILTPRDGAALHD